MNGLFAALFLAGAVVVAGASQRAYKAQLEFPLEKRIELAREALEKRVATEAPLEYGLRGFLAGFLCFDVIGLLRLSPNPIKKGSGGPQ